MRIIGGVYYILCTELRLRFKMVFNDNFISIFLQTTELHVIEIIIAALSSRVSGFKIRLGDHLFCNIL